MTLSDRKHRDRNVDFVLNALEKRIYASEVDDVDQEVIVHHPIAIIPIGVVQLQFEPCLLDSTGSAGFMSSVR